MNKNMSLDQAERDARSQRGESAHDTEWTDSSLVPFSVETRADRQILERLIKSFESKVPTMDVSAISFFVRNRIVTINGIIRDQSDRDLLASIVRRTTGVERVIDRLRISPERFRPSIFKRSA